METFNTLKTDLLSVTDSCNELISHCESIIKGPDASPDSSPNVYFDNWRKILLAIHQQVNQNSVKVAVAGPIKSGKSTFVNALFHHDYLKRGAGVVTSIVTRIKCGQELKATVYFKAWDEINRDINQAVAILPSIIEDIDSELDLRKNAHRERLSEVLAGLGTDDLITNDARNVNTVLLTSYVQGFEAVKDIISAECVTKEYVGDAFSIHRTFTGDEVLAVYVKDIEIEIQSDVWDETIEIADCQGSDSPNPLHLAMIQDYLQFTNFIVYVVSSRTGLRRADIRFLSMIKKMGIIDNILFIINCDFSEHDTIEDLNRVTEKIRQEISLIKKDPVVFKLSALYNLFSSLHDHSPETLSEKDLVRLQQWQKEADFAELTREQTDQFYTYLNTKLTSHRFGVMLTNNIERLSIVTGAMNEWADIHTEILSQDSDGAKLIIERIKGQQVKMDQVKSMIRNTIDGAVRKVKDELKKDVNDFFDEYYGSILPEIQNFIKSYSPEFESYREISDNSGVSSGMMMVFNDFRQAVDAFMAEQITPKVIGFIKTSEEKLLGNLKIMTGPYSTMITDAVSDYREEMAKLDIDFGTDILNRIETPDLDSIKNLTGLKPGPVLAIMKYTVTVKTDAIARFGFYKLIAFLKKLTKRQKKNEGNERLRALQGGLTRGRIETEKSILEHFKSYRENIKFQYFFKLADTIANSFFETYVESFQTYLNNLVDTSNVLLEKQQDKKHLKEEIKTVSEKSTTMMDIITTIRQKAEVL